MLSVLAIAQAMLDEIGMPYPASIVSTTDDSQRQLASLLLSSARSLRNQRVYPQQKKTHTITLANGRSQYPLPSDFYSSLPETTYDETDQERLIGPMPDSAFSYRLYGIVNGSANIAYRIFGPDFNPASTGGQFQIDPTPTEDGKELTFEYVTRNMFVTSNYQTFKEAFTVDTDLCLFDDDLMIADLKWRYLRAKKKEYGQEYADAKAMIDASVARFQGSFVGSMTGRRLIRRYRGDRSGGFSF